MNIAIVTCSLAGWVLGVAVFPTVEAVEAMSIESQEAWSRVVVKSEFATVVEFKSGMCLSCQEFEPEWFRIVETVKGVRFATVDIDKAFGMKLARSFGVLDEGIPNIRIFGGLSKPKGIPVFSGQGKALSIVTTLTKILKSSNAFFFDGQAHMYKHSRIDNDL